MPTIDKAVWWQGVTEYYEILNPGSSTGNSADPTIESEELIDSLRDELSPFLSGYRDYLINELGVSFSSTNKLDRLLLSGAEDFVVGQDGSDYIEGRGSDDILFGDEGSDIFSGSQGMDLIIGHDENDNTEQS